MQKKLGLVKLLSSKTKKCELIIHLYSKQISIAKRLVFKGLLQSESENIADTLGLITSKPSLYIKHS